jgi:hypothetical protein
LADAVSLTGLENVDDFFRGIAPKLTVKIVETIKGNFAGGALPVERMSSCFGYDYQDAVGHRVLLFLNKDEAGNWHVSRSPYGEINGETSGANGPWESAVRQYARIDQFNNYEQEKSALQDLQQAARTDRRNYPAGLDKDIEEHFNAPYPNKSYKDLFDLYTKGTADQKSDVLWAFAKGKHKEARPLMQSLMRSWEFETYTGPITAYVNATQDHSSIDVLGSAYLGMKEKHKRWPILLSLIELARDADMGLMLQILESADIEEAGRLSAWFVRHPEDDATQMIRRLVGSKFNGGDRWELVLSLTALGDKAVVDYAREAVASTKGAGREITSPLEQSRGWKRLTALEILARSPLPEADVIARAVIAEGNLEDIARICQSLLSSVDPNRWQRLRAVPDLKAVDESLDHFLKQMLESQAKQGDPDAKLLLDRLK